MKILLTFLGMLFFFPCFKMKGENTSMDIPSSNRLIVRFSPNTKAETFIASWNKAKTKNATSIVLHYERVLSTRLNIHLLTYQSSYDDLSEIITPLKRTKEIEDLQLDHPVNFRNLPNDPWIGRQWSVEKIGLDQVWDISTGGLTTQGDTIVIAVVDQGFDINQEDLIQNIWRNHAEAPFDGKDNDQNGYIDDETGWNFVNDGPDFTPSSHGTSVAGIIGAQGNNQIGVAGINWNIKLMLFQISEVSHIISAYEYIANQRRIYNETDGQAGSFVVATNASFGADDVFCTQEPLWGAMYDELGAVGILTGAGASNQGSNIDQVGDTPSTCASPYIVTVLNTNEGDVKEANSSYSTTYIDLASPGENSYTTKPFNRYGTFGDNSAAAPHLTGAIGLMYAIACPEIIEASKRQPAQTALFFKDLLLQGVDIIAGMDQYTLTGGRLNVWNTVTGLQASCQQEKEATLSWEKVFPNPADERIYLNYFLSANTEHRIEVYNVLGQLVWEKQSNSSFVNTLQREEVSIVNWPRGAYIIRISSDGKNIEASFIKQ